MSCLRICSVFPVFIVYGRAWPGLAGGACGHCPGWLRPLYTGGHTGQPPAPGPGPRAAGTHSGSDHVVAAVTEQRRRYTVRAAAGSLAGDVVTQCLLSSWP